MAKKKRETVAKEIRKSLEQQLEKRGADVAVYKSQIDDYMFFWEQMQIMQDDVRERGLTFTAVSAMGKEYEKDNPSIKNAMFYSKQMLAILNALGLDTKTVTKPDMGGDDSGM